MRSLRCKGGNFCVDDDGGCLLRRQCKRVGETGRQIRRFLLQAKQKAARVKKLCLSVVAPGSAEARRAFHFGAGNRIVFYGRRSISGSDCRSVKWIRPGAFCRVPKTCFCRTFVLDHRAPVQTKGANKGVQLYSFTVGKATLNVGPSELHIDKTQRFFAGDFVSSAASTPLKHYRRLFH